MSRSCINLAYSTVIKFHFCSVIWWWDTIGPKGRDAGQNLGWRLLPPRSRDWSGIIRPAGPIWHSVQHYLTLLKRDSGGNRTALRGDEQFEGRVRNGLCSDGWELLLYGRLSNGS